MKLSHSSPGKETPFKFEKKNDHFTINNISQKFDETGALISKFCLATQTFTDKALPAQCAHIVFIQWLNKKKQLVRKIIKIANNNCS